MKPHADKLYQDWLPAIHRIRDAQNGEPLRALLELLGAEADRLEGDIAQLYDNAFIETCEEWVVPYLGDLLGVRGLHPVSPATFSQRAWVANTLRYRRRKGTAAMLEQLARDTTGWNARAVEFFQRLGTTQYVNHLRPGNLRTPNLRAGDALELVGSPFDITTRTAEVRRIEPRRGQFNLPNIGLFLWRIEAYPFTGVPAFDHGSGRFSFSPLGSDLALYHAPETEATITHLATELNVPAPIRRRAMFGNVTGFYGASAAEPKDIFLVVDGAPVPAANIQVCNLSGWVRRPDAGKVAVDPALGRIAFSTGVTPTRVETAHHYGFSADLGGGDYDRGDGEIPESAQVFPIGRAETLKSIAAALTAWAAAGRPDAVLEITDSETYPANAADPVDLFVPAGRTLVLRAGRNADRQQQRPLLRTTSSFAVKGELPADPATPGGKLFLEGLLVAGQGLQVLDGDLGELQITHCTFVPGLDLKPDGTAVSPGAPSLVVQAANTRLETTIKRSITGALNVAGTTKLTLQDSIVDAAGGSAVNTPALHADAVTVFGSTTAEVIELATNCIFTGLVVATRRQEGCVRFSFVTPDSRVPRRYRCQPALAVEQALAAAAQAKGVALTPAEDAAIREPIEARIQPVFTSIRYGDAAYAQLHQRGPDEIFTGADDEAEMGAFHHLQQPQRERNLRASLDEYLRAGLEAGIFRVT